MKYLFRHWAVISNRLKNSPFVLLGLDFDGTLTPIVKHPARAKLDPGVRALIKKVNLLERIQVAILSGRALKDLQRKVGLKNIAYSGNHGYEIQLPAQKARLLSTPAALRSIRRFHRRSQKAFSSIPGVFLEPKGATFTIHYRNVPARRVRQVKNIARELHDDFKNSLRLRFGKKAIGLRPAWPRTDKGRALKAILKKTGGRKILPVYIGDDTTDEDVFRVIRWSGITIFVGQPEKKSRAEFYLKSPAEVARFIKRLMRLF